MQKFFNPFGTGGSGGGGGGGNVPDRYIEIKDVGAYSNPTYVYYHGQPGDNLPRYNFSYLAKVEMDNNFTSISDNVFDDCDNLIEVKLSKNITIIPYRAFYDCDNLTTITIPEGVTAINDDAFRWCVSLTSINFPLTLTSIGSFAFNESGLGSGGGTFTMPIANSYGSNVFDNIKAKKIIVPEGVTEFKSSEMFRNCKQLEEVQLPSTLTKINSGTFRGCSKIKSVAIPSSVTIIEEYAFEDCNDLTSLEIPGSVTDIGYRAFAYGTTATQLIFNEGLQVIGGYAFRNWEQITSLTIPNSMDTINERAFLFNYRLANLDLGTGVRVIGDFAFEEIAITELVIPASVKYIYGAAFQNCRNLERIYFMGKPDSISDYGFNTDGPSTTEVFVPWSEGEVPYAPWGLPQGTTIHYDCDPSEYPIS